MKTHRLVRVLLRLASWGLWGLALLLVYPLLGLLLGIIPVNEPPPSQAPYQVWVFSTGVHLDLCLPAQTEVSDWHRAFPPEEFGLKASRARYISFGWGDSAFYVNTPTWDQLDWRIGAQALFLPTASAMHVTYHRTAPSRPGALRVPVSEVQLRDLNEYLRQTLVWDSLDRAIRFHGSDYPPHPDAYYRARPPYHAFLTCNDWLNRGLKQAGVRAVCWTPYDQLILRTLARTEGIQPSKASLSK